MSAKALREKRAGLAAKIKEMADKVNKPGEERDFTAEEKPHWESVNKDYDALCRQIEVAERAETVDREQRDPADRRDKRRELPPGREDRNPLDERDDEERDDADGDEMTEAEILGRTERQVKPEVFNLALQGWMRARSGMDLEERHVKAARIAGVNLRRKYLDIQLRQRPMTVREMRAMSAVDLTAGASTIAPGFVNSFESAMLAFGGMRQVAEIIRTDTGAEMGWPTVNDTSNEGEIVGENNEGNAADPDTDLVKWQAYKYGSKPILVPAELLEDSAFDLAATFGRMAGERIGRRQNRDFTTGDGAGKPRGIVTAATLGKTAAGTTAITADELIELIHSVDPAYREDPSFGLMMHDNILLLIRKLKDSQNRYLFQDATASAPPTIWGAKYQINQQMASAAAASAKTVIAGQLNKYKIRDVRTIRIRRLVERYAEKDQEAFLAFQRSDGNLLDAGVAPVKYLQQAAA